MKRRGFIQGAVSTALSVSTAKYSAMAAQDTGADTEDDEDRVLPYDLVKVTGKEALARWNELTSRKGAVPVVVGTLDDVRVLEQPFTADFAPVIPLSQILDAADKIDFPAGLILYKKEEEQWALEHLESLEAEADGCPYPDAVLLDQTGNATRLSEDESCDYFEQVKEYRPELGSWPAKPEFLPDLTVVSDDNGIPLDTVYIVLVPTPDRALVPAYLRYGGWNQNPFAEFHVAAMRAWHERYGAEIIGMTYNTLNIRVHSRPTSRQEAIALARDQYE